MNGTITTEKAAELLMQHDNITLLCHRRPDGDTIGSAFALYYTLTMMGKACRVLCSDVFPDKYNYLYEGYEPAEVLDWPVEYVVAVDVAAQKLLGDLEEQYGMMVDLCIDHHPSNTGYAALTCLDSEAAAAAEVVYEIINRIGFLVEGKVAECIYTGIVTDTGCFKFSNTTPQSLRIAAELKERGTDTVPINARIFESKSKGKVTAEARLLSALEFYFDDRCAVMPVTLAVRQETGVEDEDLEDVAGMPRQIEGVLVGATIKEHPGECRVSLRTRGGIDAAEIGKAFGGGGHFAAAGCTIEGSLSYAKELLLAEIKKHLPEEP